jgi:flagellar protein FlaG
MALDVTKGVNSIAPAASSLPAKPEGTPNVQIKKSNPIASDPAQKQKELKDALAQLNKQMADNKQQLGFSQDDSISGPVIVVTNTQTGEVVRKIPSEAVIRVAHNIEALKGILFSSNT